LSPEAQRTVLVVEDDRSLVRLLELNLQAEGYGVLLCTDGVSAISRLQSAIPDVVLLVLKLPGTVSGWDVLGYIRSEARLRGVPVIVVSAYGHAQDLAQARALGAHDYLVKPFGVADLLARVAALARRPDGDP
jgi:DNA-binding response OmpR family regulator